MKTTTAPRDPAKPAELPTLVSIEQVAAHLGVTVRHVRRLVAERRIPFLKWGHLLRFDPHELKLWLEQRRIDVGRESHATRER